jgi:sulfatase maturation enzyme AslB (radical SAM superfamily)
VFRHGNPNDPGEEMDTETMLARIAEIQRRYSIETMLWMGGEPLLRPDVLAEGTRLFSENTITTTGTIDLIDLPGCLYVISIDGPPELNDAVRGKGSFEKVMKTLSRASDAFQSTISGQCVVTKLNEVCLEETVEVLRRSRIETMTFSFYTPSTE